MKDETVKFAGGAVSSPCPPYEYIPLSASKSLALRMARGVRIKGRDGAWNALSKNQASACDREFVLNRLGHVIEHAQKAIARIAGTMPPCDEEEANDGGDAGAILFGGALLAEYMEQENKKQAMFSVVARAEERDKIPGKSGGGESAA